MNENVRRLKENFIYIIQYLKSEIGEIERISRGIDKKCAMMSGVYSMYIFVYKF